VTTVTATAVLAKAEPPRVRLATSLPGHAPWPRVLTAASYQAHPALPDPAQPAEAPTRQVPPSPSLGVNVAVTRHTLSVLVENKPGVLARVSSLFSRRGFNIHSLAVGPTENPEVSRMTIVVAVEGLPLEQVTKQLNKLINVLKIVELSPTQAVQRELLLIKLRSDGATRPQIVSIVEMFRARIIDITPDAVTVEATGTSDKLEALVKMLEPFGVRELVQSGMVALGRGPRSITSASSRAD
jgi:acetolactate synthase-1/3 small subunit